MTIHVAAVKSEMKSSCTLRAAQIALHRTMETESIVFPFPIAQDSSY